MPFDSFMTAALACELNDALCGLKVDRIFQPERDQIDLLFHRSGKDRLVISCSPAAPYMALSDQAAENPPTPPMMCMLLRKHLSRSKISGIEQMGFDRVIRITFDSGDEMGYFSKRYLYCELMGRGSNLVFVNDKNTILATFRQNDITTKFSRVVLCGMPYQMMPPPDKLDPFACSKEEFVHQIETAMPDERCDRFLQKRFFGFGPLTARETAFRASGSADAVLCDISTDALWNTLRELFSILSAKSFHPCLIYASKKEFDEGAAPLDFSFIRPKQFSDECYILPCGTVSDAIESFYRKRSQAERKKQHANDIAQILKHSKSRLEKKILAQQQQLMDAQSAEEDKRMGDLITQEIYRIRRKDTFVLAIDYAKSPPEEVKIPLDARLSPSANAQKYYRAYTKKKTALIKVMEQIEIARSELDYANSMLASLETATDQASMEQIRQEISRWNYGRRMQSVLKKTCQKPAKPTPLSLMSPNGFTVLVGRNNYQNDAITFKLADKGDLWFHVKTYHGSHVVIKRQGKSDIPNEDVSFAASLAAYYSEAKLSDKAEVDMTDVRFVKKPAGARPGFVTYRNQTTLVVLPKTP